MEYYQWIQPPEDVCADPADMTLYLMDWFGPNMDARLHDHFTDTNNGHLLYPGWTTDKLQVNDTHGHHGYNQTFKAREKSSALHQLRAGAKMPCSSKQTVLDRLISTWDDLNHDRIEKGFIENGIAADLFGSEDVLLTASLHKIFEERDLAAQRREIGEDIKKRVQSGELTSWHDYKKPGFLVELLLTY